MFSVDVVEVISTGLIEFIIAVILFIPPNIKNSVSVKVRRINLFLFSNNENNWSCLNVYYSFDFGVAFSDCC